MIERMGLRVRMRFALVAASISIILAVSAALYAPHRGLPLVLGDEFAFMRQGELLLDNPGKWIRVIATAPCWIRWPSYLSMAVDSALFDRDPAGWRLTNLAIHSVNIVLVLGLAYLLTRGLYAAIAAAALFAVWPAGWMAVAWSPGRNDGFMTTAMLLTLVCWLLWRQDDHRWAYPLAVAFFALALVSKESAVTLIVVMLLAEIVLAKPPHRWKALLPFLGVLSLYGLYAYVHFDVGHGGQTNQLPIAVGTCARAVASGLGNIYAPYYSVPAIVAVAAMLVAFGRRRLVAWSLGSSLAMFGFMALVSRGTVAGGSWYRYAPSVFACIAVASMSFGKPRWLTAGLLVAFLGVAVWQVQARLDWWEKAAEGWRPLQRRGFAFVDAVDWKQPQDLLAYTFFHMEDESRRLRSR